MDKTKLLELVLIAVVILMFVFQIGKYYGRHKGIKITLKELEQLLHNLKSIEKTYLSPYVIGGEIIQYFKIEDDVLRELEKKKIIYKSSNVRDLKSGWAYNIQPWAKEYLVNNPHLLEGAAQPKQEFQTRQVNPNN